jgi:hypothetical protein
MVPWLSWTVRFACTGGTTHFPSWNGSGGTARRLLIANFVIVVLSICCPGSPNERRGPLPIISSFFSTSNWTTCRNLLEPSLLSDPLALRELGWGSPTYGSLKNDYSIFFSEQIEEPNGSNSSLAAMKEVHRFAMVRTAAFVPVV